ncbi:unnamed protein product [Calypogeia fissa]
MAGESTSMMDKMKAKVAKWRGPGHHSSSAPGTAGVHMPAVAARHSGTSAADKPSMMKKIKMKLSGGRSSAASGFQASVSSTEPNRT